MVPVKRINNAAVLIKIQKSGISVHHRLNFRRLTVGDDLSKAFLYLGRHGKYPVSANRLGLFDVVSAFPVLLKLMIHPDLMLFEVYIPDSKAAEFRYAKACMKKNIESFILP